MPASDNEVSNPKTTAQHNQFDMKFALSTIFFGGAITAALAEDGSSILKGAVSGATASDYDFEGAGLRGSAERNKSGSTLCYLGSPAQCGDGKYCKVGEGVCMIADAPISGTCTRTNVYCADYTDYVCGCDRNTYRTSCFAQQAGVNVGFKGSCPLACKVGQTPCLKGQYCKVGDGICAMTGADGFCEDKPDLSVCVVGEDEPVCACDNDTYACRDEAARVGVNVFHEGACEFAIINSGSPAQRALDILGGANSNCAPGSNIGVYDQNGEDWQRWKYNTDGSIESVFCPGMVLNIDGGVNSGCADGTNIILWPKSDVAWEKWYYASGTIYSKYCPGMVIELEGDGNGENVQLGKGDDGWDQTWSGPPESSARHLE